MLLLAAITLAGCKKDAASGKLPSGYDYILHTKSDGQAVEPNAYVYFQYTMRNDDSTVVSSYTDPVMPMVRVPDTTGLGRPLTTIEEALMLMKAGDSLTIIAPLDTVPNKPQGFEKSKFLYYDIAVKSVKTQKDIDGEVTSIAGKMTDWVAQYNGGTMEGIQTTASGLKYFMIEEGQGERPDSNDFVFVNYYGTLKDGTPFDNSFQRGTLFNFPVGMGAVIKGWDEGLALMKKGGKALLFIPSDLGYGAAGVPPTIPENAELIFYVELNDIRKPEMGM